MSSKWLLHRHNAKKAKVWANCSQNVGFHFPMCLQQCSPADASLQCMAVPQHSCTRMGRRRWPPLGEFNGILLKRLRNRCSNKQAIFHRFLLQRASVAKAPTSILYWFLQYKMALGRFSSCCFLHGFGIQKTIQKPIKNHARATQKSISKTCCFLISIFSHFGFDFGGSWASNLEPSWLKMPPPSVK